jgi:ribosome maturation factor RimP
MGMTLVELNVFHGKSRKGKQGSVQIKAVVFKDGVTGIDDCARVHRGIMPRLELAFPGKDINMEVSSPGIDRLIKDGSEFAHYIGRLIRCYRTDISGWTAGILREADEKKIVLLSEGGETILPYEAIAKARLNGAPPQGGG